jgi:hypothetical protein
LVGSETFSVTLALLKPSRLGFEDHEVVGENTQDELAPLGLVAACGECRAETALVLAKAALDAPALVIKDVEEVLAEGSPMRNLRPAPSGVTSVQSSDAALDAKLVSAEAMVMLALIASIG